jgi:hypothetical protein
MLMKWHMTEKLGICHTSLSTIVFIFPVSGFIHFCFIHSSVCVNVTLGSRGIAPFILKLVTANVYVYTG